MVLCLVDFDHHRYHRNQDDGDNQILEVMFHPGQVAEKVAAKKKQRHPKSAAHNVVINELGVVHLADTGDEGGKCPHDRHETSQDNRRPTVFIIKGLRFMEIFLLQQSVVALKNLRADEVTDPIVDRIPKDCGTDQHNKQPQD